MNTKVTALFFASLLTAATHAHAQSASSSSEHVVSATPVYVSTTRTECQTARGGGWLGPALGAILGGGAGSQVGKGSGQAAAAAIGATLGAQAGAAVGGDGSAQQAQTCRDVVERQHVGFTLRTSASRDVFISNEVINGAARQ